MMPALYKDGLAQMLTIIHASASDALRSCRPASVVQVRRLDCHPERLASAHAVALASVGHDSGI